MRYIIIMEDCYRETYRYREIKLLYPWNSFLVIPPTTTAKLFVIRYNNIRSFILFIFRVFFGVAKGTEPVYSYWVSLSVRHKALTIFCSFFLGQSFRFLPVFWIVALKNLFPKPLYITCQNNKIHILFYFAQAIFPITVRFFLMKDGPPSSTPPEYISPGAAFLSGTSHISLWFLDKKSVYTSGLHDSQDCSYTVYMIIHVKGLTIKWHLYLI